MLHISLTQCRVLSAKFLGCCNADLVIRPAIGLLISSASQDHSIALRLPGWWPWPTAPTCQEAHMQSKFRIASFHQNTGLHYRLLDTCQSGQSKSPSSVHNHKTIKVIMLICGFQNSTHEILLEVTRCRSWSFLLSIHVHSRLSLLQNTSSHHH